MAQPPPTLLTVPVEIRVQIYESLDEGDSAEFKQFIKSLCRVCRQIRAEVFPYLVQNDAGHHFISLERFTRWVETGKAFSPSYLAPVEKVYLITCLALDTLNYDVMAIESNHGNEFMMKILANGMSDETLHMIQNTASSSDPRQKSLALRTYEAFSALRSISTFSFRANVPTGQSCRNEEQFLILSLVALACPNLSSLSILTSVIPLTFLPGFPNLKFFRFNGHSFSTPAETAAIFSQLKSLKHLIIDDSYTDAYNSRRMDETSTEPWVAFTPEVMSAVNPLEVLEIINGEYRADSAFLTVEMMEAIRHHRRSLTKITIDSRGYLDKKEACAFLEVVKSCEKLECLRIDAGLDKRVSNEYIEFCLPPTMKDLWVKEHGYSAKSRKLKLPSQRRPEGA